MELSNKQDRLQKNKIFASMRGEKSIEKAIRQPDFYPSLHGSGKIESSTNSTSALPATAQGDKKKQQITEKKKEDLQTKEKELAPLEKELQILGGDWTQQKEEAELEVEVRVQACNSKTCEPPETKKLIGKRPLANPGEEIKRIHESKFPKDDDQETDKDKQKEQDDALKRNAVADKGALLLRPIRAVNKVVRTTAKRTSAGATNAVKKSKQAVRKSTTKKPIAKKKSAK